MKKLKQFLQSSKNGVITWFYNQFYANVLTIDRSKWITGSSPPEHGCSQLLNEKGFMCCLGFECMRVGVPIVALRRIPTPADDNLRRFSEKIKHLVAENVNTDLSSKAMAINDDHKIKPNDREKKIKALFKAEGITVKFIGKYSKI